MKALISGQAATAVLIDGGHFYSLDVNAPGQTARREEWEIPLLLADVSDIQEIDDTSEADVIEQLQLAWEKDRGLQLSLILLDSDEDPEIRLASAECVAEFLSNSVVHEYIANRLYSAPLPSNADIQSAISICSEQVLNNVREFLQIINDDQEEITARYRAWLNLPISLFGTIQDKNKFYFDAVRFGAFRIFATERGRRSWALIQLLSHPHFRGNSIARAVFQEWAKPFQESSVSTEFEKYTSNESLDDELEEEVRRSRRAISGHEAFAQAEKQRDTIKRLLAEGKEDLALRFTEGLIANQRRTSDPEHIAKSLCDLAQFAKNIGSPELQLEFTKKAIQENPTDSFSYSVQGDAYRALGEYQKALAAYHQAGVYGDERAALLGRAQIYKDLGRYSESLELIEQCIHDYPNDIVATNARASAIGDFGKLSEALEAYDRMIANHQYDVVTLTGRAEICRQMGKYDEALKQLNLVIAEEPDNHVPYHLRGVVLRESGRVEEALRVFAEMKVKFPLVADAHYAHSRILRDVGYFDDAIEQLRQLIQTHPFNPMGYLGLAETYKKIGHLTKAHEQYDLVLERFPRVTLARNGKASIYMAQGEYANAIKLLPANLPATHSEWIAFHIIGMGYLRDGNLQRAERIFEHGVAEVPWASHKQYFRTALASLRIQQKRFEDTIELVRDVIDPAIEPVARVLSMHAMGELGDIAGVENAYRKVSERSAPVVINLRDAMAGKYLRRTTQLPTWSERQVFIDECNSLLLAA